MIEGFVRQFPIVETMARADGGDRAVIAVHDDIGDGRPVDLRSLDFTRYWKNPVVLFEHDRWAGPVGRSTAIGWDDKSRMVADFEFLTGNPQASVVKNAWRKGFLKAASIRAIPKARNSQSSYQSGLENSHELVEWSIVTIPADPDAVRSGLTKDLETVLGFSRGETEDMDEARIAEMITRAFADRDQKGGEGFDAHALARSIAEATKTELKAILKERDEAAEATRKLEDEKTAAEKKAADELKRSTDSAEDRAELLVTIRELLPEGTVTRGKSNKDLLVLAAGEEVDNAAERSEEYLLAKVEGIVERRADATPAPLTVGTQHGGGNPKPGSAPVLGNRGLSVADMQALREFNQRNP